MGPAHDEASGPEQGAVQALVMSGTTSGAEAHAQASLAEAAAARKGVCERGVEYALPCSLADWLGPAHAHVSGVAAVAAAERAVLLQLGRAAVVRRQMTVLTAAGCLRLSERAAQKMQLPLLRCLHLHLRRARVKPLGGQLQAQSSLRAAGVARRAAVAGGHVEGTPHCRCSLLRRCAGCN